MENVFSLLFHLRDFSFLSKEISNEKRGRCSMRTFKYKYIYIFSLNIFCFVVVVIPSSFDNNNNNNNNNNNFFCSFLKCRRQKRRITKKFFFRCFPVALNDRIIKLMMLKTILKNYISLLIIKIYILKLYNFCYFF